MAINMIDDTLQQLMQEASNLMQATQTKQKDVHNDDFDPGEALSQALQASGAVIAAVKHVTAVEKPKRGLGRGLDALFADGEARQETRDKMQEAAPLEKESSSERQVPAPGPLPLASQSTLPVTALMPSAFQPRSYFNADELAALAESIRTHGILQPLLVRPAPGQPGQYEIIGGERRWRAAQLAQLHDVPVNIQNLDDRQALEIALVENIQRADLTPIEEAQGYQRLMQEFNYTQETMGAVVGKSRGHIANILRLLTLPESVRDKVHAGKLSAGAARLLNGLPQADAVAEQAIRQNLSVRQIEKLVARMKRPTVPTAILGMSADALLAARAAKKSDLRMPGIDYPMPKDADVLALEGEVSNLLGLRTEIETMLGGRGVMAVHFSSLDQLDELLRKLTLATKG